MIDEILCALAIVDRLHYDAPDRLDRPVSGAWNTA
jgi:hypothetical protein